MCPDTSDGPGRVIPPLFCKDSWLNNVNGPLPAVTVKANKDYSLRLSQAFGRYDVPLSATQLRDRWFEKLGETATHAEIAALKGVRLQTYVRSCGEAKQRTGCGYVYVVQHLSSGLHKIGVTRKDCVESRLKALGVGACSKLVHLTLTDNYIGIEKCLHHKYKTFRIPQTEYFQLDDTHIDEIKDYVTPKI